MQKEPPVSHARPDRPAGLPPEADAPSPRRAERLLFFGLATLVVVILGVAVVGVLAAPRGGTTMTPPSATPDATPPTTPGAASPATPDASAPLLQVLAVTPESVTPGQPVTLLVRVLLPDACTTPAAPRVERHGPRITVTLAGQRPADAICAQVVRETTVTVELGPLEAGEYQLVVNGTIHQLVVGSTTSSASNAGPGSVTPPVRPPGTPEGSATSSGAVVSPTPQATAPPPGSVPATMPPATPIGGSSGGLAGLPTVVIVPPHSVQIPPATPSAGSTPDASPQ